MIPYIGFNCFTGKGTKMSGLDDRKNAFENKFALDEALMLKAEARCCKLFGLWLGKEIGLSEAESQALAADLVGANLEEAGFDDVKRAIIPVMIKQDATISDDMIDAKLQEFFVEAQKQIKTESA